MNKEYTFLGLNMEKISISYGIFLIIWGLWITNMTGSDSLTSLIPSILGLPILILSFLAIFIPLFSNGYCCNSGSYHFFRWS